ncbi:MAG: hypothetical protein KC502_06060 [Myxococcales bacterium]|nr:hypothetical protein [Myxococcales bacterium]
MFARPNLANLAQRCRRTRLVLTPLLAVWLLLPGCFDDPEDGQSEAMASVDAIVDGIDTSEPCEGEVGCECIDDSECKSGWCKDGVCAEPCGGDCPEDHTCKNVGRGGKKIYECIKNIVLPDCVTESDDDVCDGKDNDCDGETDEGACDDDNPCTMDGCDPDLPTEKGDGCSHSNLNTTCSDGDACTKGDACKAGVCIPGGPRDCDDKNPCTIRTCEASKGCVTTDIEGACDDGSACTDNDACKEGKCKGEGGPECNDNNPCTSDYCTKADGCKYSDNSKNCDDGEACTTGDECKDGKCEPGIATVCDDGNPCTKDVCDPKLVVGLADGCTATAIASLCDDGDACSLNDSCVKGKCKTGKPKDCDDGNACTVDTCDKETGECKFEVSATGEVCDDGNPCTNQDVCEKGGTCIGKATDCEDNKLCTIDKCDTNTGLCFHENNSGQTCEDGDACTLGDNCIAGNCSPGVSKLCSDSQPCTSDSCDDKTGKCVFKANTQKCDDGNPCTLVDGCSDGKCEGSQLKNCSDGNVCTLNACNTATGKCETNLAADNVICTDTDACTQGDACKKGTCTTGPPLYCNDDNVCTNDTCDPKTGKCVFTPNTSVCDDGNACTVGDACGAGKCTSGKNTCECQQDDDCLKKEDANLCNGTLFCDKTVNKCKVDTNTVVICDPSKNTACTTFSCSPKSGKCEGSSKPNGSACEADESVCTQGDYCTEGACAPGKQVVCKDTNPCTDDTCDPVKGCDFVFNKAPCYDGDLCTQNDACKDGSCQKGKIYKNCSDNDTCTNDVCNPKTGNCAFLPLSGPKCSDSNACTSSDVCVDGGCKPGKAKKCDDDNPCTLDVCDPKTGQCGAKPAFDKLGCEDGQKCTKGDSCKNGKCESGPVPNCDDGSPCTKGVCVPLTGDCKQIATGNGKQCDDGNACSLTDVCKNGYCLPSGTKLCDDSNECTTDSCDKNLGVCVYKPLAKGAECTDGDLCTLNDSCDDGECKATQQAICNDNNVCTVDKCDKLSGKCLYKAAPYKPFIKCDDGNACTFSQTYWYNYKKITDVCYQGKCTGQKRSCNDNNVCTKDSCDPTKGCAHKFLGPVSCNDGNACTVGDSCKTGSCKGTGKTCNDGNHCTSNVCNKTKGCVFPFNKVSCNDGSVCTTGDRCNQGKCKGVGVLDCNDDLQCTDDPCDPKKGCSHVNDDTNSCDDGEPCTAADKCKDGKCKGDGTTDCDDKQLCTLDKCEVGKGCVHENAGDTKCDDGNKCTKVDVCAGGKCTSSGGLNCNDGNNCTTDACDSKLGCTHKANSDPCDDDNACTEGDKCAKTSCVAGPLAECKDETKCTVDSCDAKDGCTYTPATGTSTVKLTVRSDFQTQTWTTWKLEQGQQAPGNLQSAVVTYSSHPSWTAALTGAKWIWRDAKVQAPTKDETVWFERSFSVPSSAKSLQGSFSVSGDHDYSCTLNGKNVGSHSGAQHGAGKLQTINASSIVVLGANTIRCKVTNKGASGATSESNPAGLLFGVDLTFSVSQLGCDDDNACTALDVCDKGKCTGLNGVKCNDDNPCTKDQCDPTKGCVFSDNDGATCSDGNACTGGDICVGGKCTIKGPADCDDDNGCTKDTCSKLTGCVHVPEKPGVVVTIGGVSGTNTEATTTFKIDGGVLVPTNLKPAVATYDKHPEWAHIKGATWIWNEKIVTDPTKNQTVFFKQKFEVSKDAEELKGVFEVAGDEGWICRLNGLLIGKSTTAKPWAQVASQPMGTALKKGTNRLLCEVTNIGKAGSNLLTNPAGITFKYRVTWQDKNQSKPCSDGNACTKDDGCTKEGTCISGPPRNCDDDNACTVDSCHNEKGCQHVNNDSNQCNDGSICTSGDFCKGGSCLGTSTLPCEDNNPCTQNACDKDKGCVFPPASGTPKCTDGGKCVSDTYCLGGKCTGQVKDCNDKNACTDDVCDVNLGCIHKPNDSNKCDDDDTCTANDLCKNGKCLGKQTAPCDDGNACTKDSCSVANGCTHTPTTGTVCEDGSSCTLQDVCDKGTCKAGAKKACYDTEQCTVDSCDAKTGKCVFAALSDGACDDGNLCTLNDQCMGGKCQSGKAPPCGDGDPCTVDNCDPKTGKCAHDPAKESSSCNDGNLCTSSSKCSGGKCIGEAKHCDDDESCTIDSCTPSTGGCQNAPVNDGTACGKGGSCKKGVCLAP